MCETTFFSESFNPDSVYAYIRKAFSDEVDFDDLMAPLMSFIVDQYWFFMSVDILAASSMEQVYIDKHYKFDSLTKEEKKALIERIRIIFIAAKIYIASLCPVGKASMITTKEELFALYPNFAEVGDEKEIEYLIIFRNMMHIGIRVVTGKPKMVLLRAVERLEGSDTIYVTGSGQKPSVTRRIQVYEGEGGDKLRKKKRGQEKDDEVASTIEKSKKTKVVEETSVVSCSGYVHTFEDIIKLEGFEVPFDFFSTFTVTPDFSASHFDSLPFDDLGGDSFITQDLMMQGFAGSAI